MEKKLPIIIIAILILFMYTRIHINLIDNIPSVFDKSKFSVKYQNGGTWIYQDNEDRPVHPVMHDDKGNLYILNGAGDDFIRYGIFGFYKIDKINKEIIIIKNLSNFKSRNKSYFQVIEIPKDSYSEIITNDKIRIRIKFRSAYQLIEYNFQNKDFKIIDYNIYAK